MKRLTLMGILCIALTAFNMAQNIVISGTVTDLKSGETIISANIYNASNLDGTVSNYYGFYSFHTKAGKQKVVCSYVGYKSVELELNLSNDTVINFKLDPSITMEEVIISSTGTAQKIRSTQMSQMAIKNDRCETNAGFIWRARCAKIYAIIARGTRWK